MRAFYFTILSFFLLLSFEGIAIAQDPADPSSPVLNPYIGFSVNVSSSVPQVGFGIELGAQYKMIYFGAEYGIYGFTIYRPIQTYDPVTPLPGYQPPDEIVSQEPYYGFHAGIIYKKTVWFGVAFLWSNTTIHHSAPVDSTFRSNSGYDYTQHSFTVGPDIRFTISDRLTLDFAYTNRRGLKIGMAYLF